MAILVNSDQIAEAMKNHVIPVKTAIGDELVEYKDVAEAKVGSGRLGTYIPGKRAQKCEFCKKKFEKVLLHSPYCQKNPNRIVGSRGMAIVNERRNAVNHEDMHNDMLVEIVKIANKSSKTNSELAMKFEEIGEWTRLTRKLLGI